MSPSVLSTAVELNIKQRVIVAASYLSLQFGGTDFYFLQWIRVLTRLKVTKMSWLHWKVLFRLRVINSSMLTNWCHFCLCLWMHASVQFTWITAVLTENCWLLYCFTITHDVYVRLLTAQSFVNNYCHFCINTVSVWGRLENVSSRQNGGEY